MIENPYGNVSYLIAKWEGAKGMAMTINLFTCGYGRTSKEAFLEKLANIEGEVVVYDVRKQGSGSVNGRWAWVGFDMEQTLSAIGIRYHTACALSNPYGNSVSGLAKYETKLDPGSIELLGDVILFDEPNNGKSYIIMCAEKDPFKPVGGKLNCHRVIVACKVKSYLEALGHAVNLRHI